MRAHLPRRIGTSSGQRGSAVVEMALVSPLFVVLLFWGAYVTDLGRARIKQQEAARFLTWELTAHALSDPVGAEHGVLFEAARERILDETFRRYRTLEGHGPDAKPQGLVSTASLDREQLGLEAVGLDASGTIETPGEPMGSIEQVVGLLGRAQRPLLERFRFNLDRIGGHATVKATVENRLMPARFLDGSFFSTPFFPERFDRLELAPATMHLETDTWALADGGDVNLGERDAPLFKQVDRIALLGLGSELAKGAGAAAEVFDWFPIKTAAQVVSRSYGEGLDDRSRVTACSENALARSGKWKNGGATLPDRMSKVKCFDTLPIDADKIGSGYRGDPSYRMLESRSNAYMGCREPGGCGSE